MQLDNPANIAAFIVANRHAYGDFADRPAELQELSELLEQVKVFGDDKAALGSIMSAIGNYVKDNMLELVNDKSQITDEYVAATTRGCVMAYADAAGLDEAVATIREMTADREAEFNQASTQTVEGSAAAATPNNLGASISR